MTWGFECSNHETKSGGPDYSEPPYHSQMLKPSLGTTTHSHEDQHQQNNDDKGSESDVHSVVLSRTLEAFLDNATLLNAMV